MVGNLSCFRAPAVRIAILSTVPNFAKTITVTRDQEKDRLSKTLPAEVVAPDSCRQSPGLYVFRSQCRNPEYGISKERKQWLAQES